jgi:DNA invertase Pin-like site-specific DNA recombinase
LDYTRYVTIALTYRRVSTEEQGKEGLSLHMQAKENLRYLDQRGFYLGPQFVDVLSGMRDDRPGYQALLQEIRRLRKQREDVVVVVFRLDRFGRDTEERARSWKELVKLGVRLHSVTEGGEIEETQAYALAFAAQMLVTASRDNIRRSLKGAQDNGWWTSGRCPYGYRWRPRTDQERARGAPRGVLDIDPVTAPHVVEAFDRLAAGASAGSVHKWLTSLPTEDRGGRAMHRRSAFLMFKSPMYMGRREVDGQPGNWPALVEEETWRAAQRVFDGLAVGGQRAATGRYLLSGFLTCSACGHPMVGTSVGTSERHQVRYRCKAREYGKACSETVAVAQVDTVVLKRVAAMVDWLVNPMLRAELIKRWTARRTKVVPNVERQRRQLERELARENDRRMQLMDRWLDKRISDDEFYAYRAKLDEAKRALDEQLAGLVVDEAGEPELPAIDGLLPPAPAWLEILRTSNDIEAQRRVLSVFIASVVARRTGWGRYDVACDFTPLGKGLAMLTPPGLEEVG